MRERGIFIAHVLAPSRLEILLYRHLMLAHAHSIFITTGEIGVVDIMVHHHHGVPFEKIHQLDYIKISEDFPRPPPQELIFEINCVPYRDDMAAELILEQGLLEYTKNRYEQLLVPIIPKIKESQTTTTPFLSGRPPPHCPDTYLGNSCFL